MNLGKIAEVCMMGRELVKSILQVFSTSIVSYFDLSHHLIGFISKAGLHSVA